MSHILYRLSPESAPVFLPGGCLDYSLGCKRPWPQQPPARAPRYSIAPRSQRRAVLHRYAHCIHKLEITPPNIQQNIDLSEIHHAKESSNHAAYSRYEYYPALEISCLVQPDGVIIQHKSAAKLLHCAQNKLASRAPGRPAAQPQATPQAASAPLRAPLATSRPREASPLYVCPPAPHKTPTTIDNTCFLGAKYHKDTKYLKCPKKVYKL